MDSKQPSKLVRAVVYVVLGLIVAADCYLSSFTFRVWIGPLVNTVFHSKSSKMEKLSVAMDIAVYKSIVASLVTLVGLFTSGEWKDLRKEMLTFGQGKKESYILTLAWTAIAWQVFKIGALGLILEVSSLFSNVMSVLALAIFFFHEKWME
ncbi:Purine permease [Parasponia andersonii]|uniref:Purine permease n=1 Tax=Parasponia andersonii TaxID=3476 RepID=A0A2P5ALD5_PARAD|nr:Purine permease [Parasponia andersonii]